MNVSVLGGLTLAAAASVLLFGALSWGGGLFGAVSLLLQLGVLATVTGGVFNVILAALIAYLISRKP